MYLLKTLLRLYRPFTSLPKPQTAPLITPSAATASHTPSVNCINVSNRSKEPLQQQTIRLGDHTTSAHAFISAEEPRTRQPIILNEADLDEKFIKGGGNRYKLDHDQEM